MPSRDWSKWPKRLKDEANSEAGVVALLTSLVAAGGAIFAAPVVLVCGATVTIGAIGWGAYQSIPPKRPRPPELMGQLITDLSVLETIDPNLKKIGFIGPSRVGKITLLKILQAQGPDGVITDNPYAVVVLLQTQPLSYFGLIDAAGQAYSQQFKVFNASDKVIILLDHTESDDGTRVSKNRLLIHDEFLAQLYSYIKTSGRDVSDVHFLLNKKGNCSPCG